MKALAVFGGGGRGGVVKDIAELVGQEIITFFDKIEYMTAHRGR